MVGSGGAPAPLICATELQQRLLLSPLRLWSHWLLVRIKRHLFWCHI